MRFVLVIMAFGILFGHAAWGQATGQQKAEFLFQSIYTDSLKPSLDPTVKRSFDDERETCIKDFNKCLPKAKTGFFCHDPWNGNCWGGGMSWCESMREVRAEKIAEMKKGIADLVKAYPLTYDKLCDPDAAKEAADAEKAKAQQQQQNSQSGQTHP